jgi:7-carboxy-7-deazaguanine synthase
MITLPNAQPIERQELDPEGVLDIQEIFSTVQGEGPLAGSPAVFVRLAGCDLLCPGCDTDYTSARKMMSAADVGATVRTRLPPNKLVVLTGGEPYRQNVVPLLRLLLLGHVAERVQVETNGTLNLPYDEVLYHPLLDVVCSPKAGRVTLPANQIKCFKYVLAAGQADPEDGLPTDVLGRGCRPARPHSGFRGEVFVQPQDDQDAEKNRANTQAALDSCMKYGYRFSYQLHKIVGLP